MINNRRLFVCSCIALVASAFTFSLHGDSMKQMGVTFNFSEEQNGEIGGGRFLGMAISMLVGGFICDVIGMKRVMMVAFVSHLAGALGMVFSKQIIGTSSPDAAHNWLWWSAFLLGCGNGATEVGINPLVATLYSRDKTHFLNILHAWWPGGLMIGGLLAVFLRDVIFGTKVTGNDLLFGFEYWQICLGMIIVPTLVYGAILVGSEFPTTERVASGVSTGDMLMQALRPMFLLWAFCMLLTAATELGPQNWQNSVMTSTAGVSGTLILVYTSGMMFVLRHFAGPIAHKLSPVGMLTISALLSAVGLFLLSYANNAFTAFAYATIYGLGIAFFWPTMLGVAAERFPRGGALVLALMGSAGNLSIAYVLPEMGKIADRYAVEHVEASTLSDDEKAQILKENDDEPGKFAALDSKAMEKLKSTAENSPEYQIGRAAERRGYSMAFRLVAILPVVLVFVFGVIALSDKARGGYKPEVIQQRH